MKAFKLIAIFYFINCYAFGQLIAEKSRFVQFGLNEYKLNHQQKQYIDSLGYSLEESFKQFDYKVKIKEMYLVSVLCENEKDDSRLSQRRIKSVKKYIKKAYKTEVAKFKCVARTDYYTKCGGSDHGVEISFMFDQKK
jgi:hypothetical protein